jgi:hypothetical protein
VFRRGEFCVEDGAKHLLVLSITREFVDRGTRRNRRSAWSSPRKHRAEQRLIACCRSSVKYGSGGRNGCLWMAAGLLLCAASSGGAERPPVSLFSTARGTLQRFQPRGCFGEEARSGIPSLAFETATASESSELYAQRHEAMNGRPILRPGAVVVSSPVMRTLNVLLPRGTTLLRRNPNARRDPLEVDGW